MNNNEILISVIVTVYNNEQYIKKCLETIIPQLNSKIELIIVDDGSSDSTINICNEIIKGIRNITIVLNEHHGLSNSRNTGIKKAMGKYIVFVDGDDWIEQSYLNDLENIISSNNSYDVILINTCLLYTSDAADEL